MNPSETADRINAWARGQGAFCYVYANPDATSVTLDGGFTLDELKQLVSLWEGSDETD